MSDGDREGLAETAETVLEQFRVHPEWTENERDRALDRLVERFEADEVVEAVRARLHDLSGADAEVLLRLVEAHPRPDLQRALAEALLSQPDLAPERAWEALAVLEGAGMFGEYALLAERWEDLGESLDDEGSIEDLVEQIEEDPEGLWLAVQGLAAVEPEVRVEIVRGLSQGDAGLGVVEFLRLLAYSHDPKTRDAALEGLVGQSLRAGLGLREVWEDLARHHPDQQVSVASRNRFEESGLREEPRALARVLPTLERSLVSGMDGGGRATIALQAVRGGERATGVFQCDIDQGIFDVYGDAAASSAETFEEVFERLGSDVVEGSHGLALGLLAGCLTLCGPTTTPALRYWVEATAGSSLRPSPFRAEFPDWDPETIPFEEMAERAQAILDACPDWKDRSALTYELAEEIRLREGNSPPDPRRDAGAYRFLFEHRLRGALEGYRRKLLWMAWCWRSAGKESLGRSALAVAWQLGDAQHLVPGHPFTVALSTRSLSAAVEDLRAGEGWRPVR